MYNTKIKTTPSTYFCIPSLVLHLFPTACKIHFNDYFKFVPAGKNLPKVKHYVRRGATVLYFSTLPHKQNDFREKKIFLNIRYMFWCSLQCLSETFIILRSAKRDINIYVHKPQCNFIHYSCQILKKLQFSRQIFEKILKISCFMKLHPVGAKLFHDDGRKERLRDRRTWRIQQSLFAILRMRTKNI